jgi:hypothetical protein
MRRWNDDAGYLHMLFMNSCGRCLAFLVYMQVSSYQSCLAFGAAFVVIYHAGNAMQYTIIFILSIPPSLSLSLSRNLTLYYCTTQHKHASIGLPPCTKNTH